MFKTVMVRTRFENKESIKMNPTQTITLGGGCFWCTEAVYVRVKGVCDVESGYANGWTPQPSYEQVHLL